MQLREVAESKTDMFRIDPRKLKIEPGFNVRDFSIQENIDHVNYLKESIREIGLREPLVVRMKDDEAFIVGGECRFRAIMALIDEGVPIEDVICIPEPKNIGTEQRYADLHVRNTGKRFSLIEQAALAKRLISFGWSESQIAKNWGVSASNISKLLSIDTLPEQAKQLIRQGDVAPTVALQAVRDFGETEGPAVIAAAVESAREAQRLVEDQSAETPPPAKGKTKLGRPKGPPKERKVAAPKATPQRIAKAAASRGLGSKGPRKMSGVMAERVVKFMSGLSKYRPDFTTHAAWESFKEDYEPLYEAILKDLNP
ncbi:MAG: ParB N-terminal domain-containing protein [Patescibacteria group bacterium]|nr:ParB N-terminal domain-containing protein [Patescibacteria group bacterium]